MGMYGREKSGPRFGTDISTGPGLTKQAFADEVNINKIVAGFEKTGMVNHLNSREPFYGDVSEISQYQDALNIVKEADELFMGMDAKVRERFANDPVKMIEFLQDSANLDEALKLGMVVKRPEVVIPAPIVPVIDPNAVRAS